MAITLVVLESSNKAVTIKAVSLNKAVEVACEKRLKQTRNTALTTFLTTALNRAVYRPIEGSCGLYKETLSL